MREAIGARGDEGRLSWLYTGTFLAMLATNPVFAALLARVPRRTLVPGLYLFFAGNLLLFWIAFSALRGAARDSAYAVYFVWLSVFNLTAVTTFWGLLVDVFDVAQAKRRFGSIAAGGTAGAIGGSLLADFGARSLGFAGLLLVSAVLLVVSAACARLVLVRAPAGLEMERPLGGPALQGWREALGTGYLRTICVYLLLFTITSTFVYYQQNALVRGVIADDAERTSYYARINYGANLLTLVVQLVLTTGLLRRLGIGRCLATLPALSLLGFAVLSAFPTLAVVGAFEVLRRSGHFAVSKPAQEVLFTVVDREQKYKAKSFIDTVVYRGGDVVAAWGYTLLVAQLGFLAGAICAATVSLAWGVLALALGAMHERRAGSSRGLAMPGA